MELQTDEGNFHALKILISASVNGQSLGTKFVSSNERVVDYIQRNRLPVLKTVRGVKLFSPNAAASFLFAEAGKLGDATKVEEWLEWESSQFLPVIHRAVLTSGGKLEESLLNSLRKGLQTVENGLGNRKHLLGSNLSVADVIVWSTIFPLLQVSPVLKSLVEEHGKVLGWFQSLEKNAAFKDAVHALFKNDSKTATKASITAQPVPPAVGSSTRKLLGSEQKAAVSSSVSVELEAETMATTEEKAAAVEAWVHGRAKVAKPTVVNHPVLPVEGRRNILITSALPYVNNVPHLGNIIGCVLSADVFARYCRLRNYNTLYISGTDEYGTATETKALEEGLTPKQICDKYNKLHTEIYDWFNIRFDFFGRTTTKHQTEIAQDIFWKLQENGYILKDSVDQLQCQQCNRFLADRFVEGTCPFCAYDDARGDQCDKCGKLINAAELINPRCKQCGNTPVVKTTSHLFLDLPKLEPQLVAFLEGEFKKGLWTSNAKVITRSWIRDGLKPRCISRDLKWGTPVPLEGYTDKVFYVWYDAPIGYMSITANYTDQWEKWWKNPSQVAMYEFMAKDNIPFHSVIFPCSLLGTNMNWTMVNHLSATEYLNYEDTKFSKSRGVGVFGNNAKDTGIPADIWRFYLLYLRPESQDSSFSWDDFVLKNNSELLNNLGNFINRALMFVNNNFNGAIPAVTLTEEDTELLAQVTRELKLYGSNLEKIRLRDGIRNMLSISRLGNQYMQANKPWVLVKGSEEEKSRAGSVVGLAANIACLLSVLVQPYMPEVSATIQRQLNAPGDANILTEEFVCFLPQGHKIGKPQPLFQKIEPSRAAELKNQFAGDQSKVASTTKPPVVGSGCTGNPEVIAKLMEAVSKQGTIVRELKVAKVDKAIIGVEVSKLLDLKQQLADISGQAPATNTKKQKVASTTKPPVVGSGRMGNPEVIAKLMEEVSKQGSIVRELKAAKVDKAIIGVEVSKLLDLKQQLADMSGNAPATNTKKQKSVNESKAGAAAESPAAASAPSAPSAESPEIVLMLTQQVTKQGAVVRDVKAAKAEKATIDAEVAKLLDLKRLLAVATGIDPEEAVGGNSRRKGKKK